MNFFCNKTQSNRMGQCWDCHCGPALESSAPPTCYALRAEVRHAVGYSGETEDYLVLVSEGKSWPYMYIPEDMPDHVLDAALAKLNA